MMLREAEQLTAVFAIPTKSVVYLIKTILVVVMGYGNASSAAHGGSAK